MRTSMVFLLGLLVGLAVAFGLPTTHAQGTRIPEIEGVNHVGITLQNWDEDFAFYTQKMGFREVFTQKNAQGNIQFSFVQAGPSTFLELAPANANRPAGISHFGIGTKDINAAIAALKGRGVTVSDPRSVGEQWMLSAATGPNNLRIEIYQLGPESPLEKATASFGK